MKKTYSCFYYFCLSIFILVTSVTNSQTPNPNMWITNGPVYDIASTGNSTYLVGNFTQVGPYTGNGALFTPPSITPDPNFPKFDGTIHVIVPDGNGGWFVGGDFTKAGDVTRNRIARINSDGTLNSWYPTGLGTVYTISKHNNDVYLGGSFGIRRYNNLTAELDNSFNANPNGTVYTCQSVGGEIFIGGTFNFIGGQSKDRLAKVNYSGNAIGSFAPTPNGVINTLLFSGGSLYVGGSFTTIGNGGSHYNRNRIAKLDGGGNTDFNWDANASSTVLTLAISGSELIAGGNFTSMRSTSRSYIAKMNLTTGAVSSWNPSASDPVNSISVNGNDVYVGGNFTFIGGQSLNRIAKIDNTTGLADANWKPKINNLVRSVSAVGSKVYAGGDFNSVGFETKSFAAKLNNITGGLEATWNPTFSNGVPVEIALVDNDVFIAGGFTSVSGNSRLGIAKVNNSTGAVNTSWNANSNGSVTELVIHNNEIYVAGNFSSIGGQGRNRIAKLNNSSGTATSWNPNANNDVYSIAVSDNDVYVGGIFTSIGGQSRNGIAKLNNSSGSADVTWNANANFGVQIVYVNNNDIYAGGSFTTIGGQTRNRIAKLNHTDGSADDTWNPNSNGVVNTFALAGSFMYAGGSFTTIGGLSRNRIAKINISNGSVDLSWNPNSNNTINQITINGNLIFAGGNFTTMGGSPAPYLVQFQIPSSPVSVTNPASNVSFDSAILNGEVNPSGGSTNIYFEWGTDNTLTTFSTTTSQPIGTGSSSIPVSQSISGLSSGTAYYFRVVGSNSEGTTKGSILSFTTTCPPSVSSSAVSNLSSNSAQLNGIVNPNGSSTDTYFEWGTDNTLTTFNTTASQNIGSGTSAVNISANISGLIPNTTYYFRAVGINSSATVKGSILSFTTSASAPTVITTAAANLTVSSATLNGTVNPKNFSTNAYFEWGTDNTLKTFNTTSSQNIGSDTSAVAVSADITGLLSSTTYYFRAVGVNAGGTVKGAIEYFTTPAPGLSIWVPFQTNFIHSLFDISFSSGNGTTGFAVGEQGTIMRSSNSGANWQVVHSVPGKWFTSVKMISPQVAYAVGTFGLICKTTDGGNTWIDQSVTGNEKHFNSVSVVTADIAEAVGYAGTFYTTTDGGATAWTQNTQIPWTMYSIALSPDYLISGKGIIAATDGRLYRRTSSGSWVFVNVQQSLGVYDNLNSVVWISNLSAVIVGNNGRILKTTNSGSSWTVKTSPTGQSLRAVDVIPFGTGEYIVIAVGDAGTIIRSQGLITTAGNVWTQEASGTDRNLYGVSLPTINNGYTIGEITGGSTAASFMNNNLSISTTSVTPVSTNIIPSEYELIQNYPNPFNPVTKIKFGIPETGIVKLIIYDMTGRMISQLVNMQLNAGYHEYSFDASGYSSGTYFYRLESDGFVITKKMLLLK